MPYTLTFNGDFFQIADFIKGLDSLVKTENAKVAVDGRLITIDGFSLASDPDAGFPALEATFSVTTYLTPPNRASPPARRRPARRRRPRRRRRRRPEERHEAPETARS